MPDRTRPVSAKRPASAEPVLVSLGWDDLRLAGLKLVFLVVSRAMSLFRLPHRESWRKDAKILMLRHQLAVAQKQRPRGACAADVARPGVAGAAGRDAAHRATRLAGMRLIVTPGTIMGWHRDIVRRRWARLSRQGRSGRPATHRDIRSVVLRLESFSDCCVR